MPWTIGKAADVALVLALTAFYQVEVWLPGVGHPEDGDPGVTTTGPWIAAVLGLALTLVLVERRRWPLLGLAWRFRPSWRRPLEVWTGRLPWP